MGNGNDELGEILMKGFVYTLTESKPYPKSILLVNSAVKLSTSLTSAIKDTIISAAVTNGSDSKI